MIFWYEYKYIRLLYISGISRYIFGRCDIRSLSAGMVGMFLVGVPLHWVMVKKISWEQRAIRSCVHDVKNSVVGS